ncbi:MAG: amino acid adenylation domain-containing protein [Deltaproteobacteria bacterium]|nr:amino acid adenylation domain-containing protein [Deltaproteobacteria bacterium]
MRRTHHDHRLAVVGRTGAELCEGLGAFLAGETRPGLSAGTAPQGRRRKLVFVFPGQGGQWEGMGRDLLAGEPDFRAAIEECGRALAGEVDWSLVEVLERGSLEGIDVVQPVLFAVQVGLAAMWRSWGVEPDAVVGHSMGEVAAAYVSGALELGDAARIIARRSRLLRRVSGRGAMGVVELGLDETRRALRRHAERVAVAASNGPTTTVVSGDAEAVAEVLKELEAAGVFCRPVKVDVASHSPQMDELRGELGEALGEVRPRAGGIPLYSTVVGRAVGGSECTAGYWMQNLREPVLFAPMVERLGADGHELFVEVSPHPTLTMAVGETLRAAGAAGAAVPSLRRDADGQASLVAALGALWAEGYEASWERRYPSGGNVVALPTYPWQRERHWHAATPRAAEPAMGDPLLGRRLDLAHLPGSHVFEKRLDLQALPYLADHCVEGTAVLPGTAYVEMALAAAAEILGDGPRALEDITFHRIIFLANDRPRTVQVVVDADLRFEIYSRAADEPEWTLHASGTILRDAAVAPTPLPVAELRDRCKEEIPAADFYRASAERGNAWGPSFQGLTRLWRGESEALGELDAPAALGGDLDRYQLHPALLDAALHPLGAAISPELVPSGGTFVFAHIGAMRSYRRLPTGPFSSHAVLHAAPELGPGFLEGNVTLFDPSGARLVDLSGVRVRALDPGAALPADDVSEWLYEIAWRSPPAWAPGPAPDGSVIVLGDRSGIARALAAHPGVVLAPAGDDPRAVLSRAPAPVRAVVHLGALEAAPESDAARLSSGCADLCAGVARLVAALPTGARLWLVTRGAQPATGAPAAAQAPMWGLGRTLALEAPAVWGGLVDLDPGARDEESGESLWQALHATGGEDQIALRGGEPLVPRLVRLRCGAGRPLCARSDATYLITGGLGDLGLLVARWLAERGARHVALLGRSELPPREAWDAIADERMAARVAGVRAIEDQGSMVYLWHADVADEARLRELIAAHGGPPIRGVVHAAGVVELGLIQELAPPAFESVMRPKVAGAWALHRVFADTPLDFFVLFSSGASLLSSPLLGAYAAGNAFLDALAHERAAAGLTALSINWGFWSEVGLAARLQREAGRESGGLGMRPFTPAQGLRALERLIAGRSVQAAVMPVDWGRWRRSHPGPAPLLEEVAKSGSAAREERGTSGAARAEILTVSPEARAGAIASYLSRAFARVLRLPESKLDRRRPVNALGLDSLMAIELKNTIERELAVTVPVITFLKGASVDAMAASLAEQLAGATQDGGTPVPGLPVMVPDLAHRFDPFPLNDIQQAYWIGRQADFELGNVSAHIYLELDGRGLDLDRLERAFDRLVERHEMLRTIVLADGRQQTLERVPSIRIERLDLVGLGAPEAEGLSDLRERFSHEVTPTDSWPLFRLRAALLGDERVRLFIGFDLLVADIWSLQIILREWWRLYQDSRADLPALELGFRDYVLAEARLQESPDYQKSLAYWRDRLRELPKAPDLPLARSPSALDRPRFRRRSGRLERPDWEALKDRGTRVGLTPSGLLLAAFGDVLAAWSKSRELTVNVTLFNRLPLHPQVADIVGDFTSVNLVAVDATIRDGFEDHGRRVQEQLWENLEHSQVSGVRVLRELARSERGAPGAAMPIVFTSTLTSLFAQERTLPMDWLGEVVYGVSQTPQVWLDHQVFEQEGALAFNWDAVEDLFPAGMLDEMLSAYVALLERLARHDDAWRSPERGLLPQAQLVRRVAYNATAAPVPTGLLHEPFARKAAERPDARAVVAGDRALSYGELRRRASRLARRLRTQGAGPGRFVAVVMEKGWEQIVAVLGVLEAGAAYVPIDAELPSERLAYLLENAEATIAVTQPWQRERVRWPAGTTLVLVDDTDADAPCEPLAPAQSPDDLAYVIYTSGSTGQPKGVMIDHRGALNTVVDVNQRFHVGPGDSVLALSSLSFDLSVYDVFGLLAAGGTVVVPEKAAKHDPARWAELIAQESVTVWSSVPALMQLFADEVEELRDATPLPLRLAMLSGDWIPLALPARIRSLARGVEVVSLGGATEASIWSILYPVDAVDPDWRSIPYGRPMLNQTFHVLDAGLEPCPEWVTGQLFIGGVGLARGYLRDPEKSARSFFDHPRTGERLYRTGDLGRFIPDGTIELVGREDFQVKIHGYRIELGEIEAALETHPAVRAAVVAAPGERAAKRLVGYVVPASDPGPSTAELRQHLACKLPEHMVPATFVTLERLPLTPNGKVDRKALPVAAPATHGPAPHRSDLGAVESRVAAIIGEVLQIDPPDRDADLLDLGVSSMEIIRIARKLEHDFGRRPRVDEFYANPTVAGLAELFGGEREDAAPEETAPC